MNRKSLIAGAAALATAVAVASGSPAGATGISAFSYYASAGATQVQALGVTVQSDPTAVSVITGNTDGHMTQKVLTAKAGTLLSTGVATSETTATVDAQKGVSVTAHSHTAAVSLLGGLIKLSAVDTISTINADPGSTPTASMTTQLLGLTINGKSYPANINPNTGITIPGIVSIQLNQQQIATSSDSAVVIGAGLKLTLLGSRNGASAGAIVQLNPIINVVGPGNGEVMPGYGLGGAAYGAYAFATVGSDIQAETGKLAMISMPAQGTGGRTITNSTAKSYIQGLLNLGVITSSQTGIRNDALSQSTETSSLANVNLLGGLITAKAVSATAQASVGSDSSSVTGSTTLVSLVIGGHAIPANVGPNTSITIPNVATVTINEQKTAVTNAVHVSRTIALHITLLKPRAGLPVGAEIQVGYAQAQVYA